MSRISPTSPAVPMRDHRLVHRNSCTGNRTHRLSFRYICSLERGPSTLNPRVLILDNIIFHPLKSRS